MEATGLEAGASGLMTIIFLLQRNVALQGF